MSISILFNLALVFSALAYVLACRIHLSKLYSLLAHKSSTYISNALADVRLKVCLVVPFTQLFWAFVMWRGFSVMQAYGIDPVTSWGVVIFAGVYGAYTLFFHSVFNLIPITVPKSEPVQ